MQWNIMEKQYNCIILCTWLTFAILKNLLNRFVFLKKVFINVMLHKLIKQISVSNFYTTNMINNAQYDELTNNKVIKLQSAQLPQNMHFL